MISFIVGLAILAFCVYDYRSSRDWQQMTSSSRNEVMFRSRNRRYGAYDMRKSYNRLMATLMIGACILTLFSMGANAVYHAGSDFQTRQPQVDTTLLSLNAPPIEPIQTLPESVQIAPAQKQEAQGAQKETPKQDNQPQDNTSVADPVRNTQMSETNPVKKDKSKMTPEERVRAEEAELRASMPGVKERERLLKEQEERRAQRERDAQNKKNDQKTPPVKKTEGGAAVVTFNLEGRSVQKEMEDIPIPAYMCKVGGIVRVDIKVLSNGAVIATAKDTDVDPCLMSEALKYAKKARFQTTSQVQYGWIEYKFHQQ